MKRSDFKISKSFSSIISKMVNIRWMVMLIMIMSLMMPTGCNDNEGEEPDPEPQPDPTYTVSFTVYLTDGTTPADLADVNLKGTGVDETSTTDSEGKVSFEDLLAGTYNYTITYYTPVQQAEGSYVLSETSDKNITVTLDALPQEAQLRVQVLYDADNVAFRYAWKSMKKTLPEGYANNGLVYPGHFHDMLKHNGTKFDRLPSDARMQEDRVTFMIDEYDGSVAGFNNATCAMTCHDGMASHNLTNPGTIDHWHWRGGRIGPAGYAEDAAVSEVERIRDNVGTPPSKFLRSGGDRLRENQAALGGTGHEVLEDGLPRFVFNKGKEIGDYTVPNYFISSTSGSVIEDPYTELPLITDLSANRSLLVVYQNEDFDALDKVNAIDLGYLVYVATASVAHLPAHLQDPAEDAFTFWSDYWANQLGIEAADEAAALAILDAVHAEWLASGENAMVARSVGFIYESDQHDITAMRAFDEATGEWSVVMYRKLSTGSDRDVDLVGLPSGIKYAFSVAMHDVGGAAISHDMSMPLTLSNEEGTDVVAMMVSDVKNVSWANYPAYDAYYVKRDFFGKWTEEWLDGSSHFGAGSLDTQRCIECHKTGGVAKVLTDTSVRE